MGRDDAGQGSVPKRIEASVHRAPGITCTMYCVLGLPVIRAIIRPARSARERALSIGLAPGRSNSRQRLIGKLLSMYCAVDCTRMMPRGTEYMCLSPLGLFGRPDPLFSDTEVSATCHSERGFRKRKLRPPEAITIKSSNLCSTVSRPPRRQSQM